MAQLPFVKSLEYLVYLNESQFKYFPCNHNIQLLEVVQDRLIIALEVEGPSLTLSSSPLNKSLGTTVISAPKSIPGSFWATLSQFYLFLWLNP